MSIYRENNTATSRLSAISQSSRRLTKIYIGDICIYSGGGYDDKVLLISV